MEDLILILILALQLLKVVERVFDRHIMSKMKTNMENGLSKALTDHASQTIKGIKGCMGYYEGKQRKTAETQLEGLGGVVDQIKPFAELLKGAEGNSTNGKKDGWL